MKIFNFNTNKKTEQAPISTPEVGLMEHLKFSLPEPPKVYKAGSNDYLNYGNDNLYPEDLRYLAILSNTHGSIVTSRADMMAGKGFLVNGTATKQQSEVALKGLDLTAQANYKEFLKNPLDSMDLYDIKKEIALDFQLENRYSMEVFWSLDFSRITKIKYVPVKDVRPWEMLSNGKIPRFSISEDWSKRNVTPRVVEAFNPNTPEIYLAEKAKNKDYTQPYNQLIYVTKGSDRYFGTPYYKNSLSWINIDIKMSVFYNALLDNGFNVNLIIQYFQKPGPEKQASIVDSMKRKFGSVENSNKPLIIFSDGKELAPSISTVQSAGIDKQYLQLSEAAMQNILTGGKVTSPLLFGITTPGSIGGQGTELETAYKIFNNSVIAPDREILEKTFNEILEINKIPVTITIEAFNPLADDEILVKSDNEIILAALNSLSPLVANKVLESMTADEIRSLVSLPPAPVETTTVNTTPPTQ